MALKIDVLSISVVASLALLSSAAPAQEKQDATTSDVAAPLERPGSRTEANGAPAPPPTMPRDNSAPGTADYYQAAQAAYKAALRKASSDHKTALEGCRTLAKPEQKICTDDADAHLKTAKSEALRLKPAT